MSRPDRPSRPDSPSSTERTDAAARRGRESRDLVAAAWGAFFLLLAALAGWAGLGHHLDARLLTTWAPLALIVLGVLVALASSRRR